MINFIVVKFPLINRSVATPIVMLIMLSFRSNSQKKKNSLIEMPFGISTRLYRLFEERIKGNRHVIFLSGIVEAVNVFPAFVFGVGNHFSPRTSQSASSGMRRFPRA